MTVKYRWLLGLLAVLLQPVGLFAAQIDSLAFNQGRTHIWCETARFIYEDNGADSLLASINCQSIEQLKASIGSTDGNLGALRLLSSVDKPAIYAGFPSTQASLEKLVNEIVAKLKSSPVRRSNPVRLNSVDSLQQQLMLVALQTGAPEEAGFTGTENEEVAEDDEAALLPVANTEEATASETPWNEILQWLALLLIGGFALWRLLDLQGKYDRLKREQRVLEKQVNEFFYSNLQMGSQAGTTAEALSEKDIRQVVQQELQQSKPIPVQERNAVPLPPPPIPETRAKPLVEPTPPPQSSPEQAAAPANPPRLATSGNTPGAARENGPADLYYDKMPFKGGFHQNEMSRERMRDSLYTFQLMPQQPGEADYWITEDSEVQRYAMQNGLSFFEEGCEFTEVDENPARVVNERKGRLRKEGPVWKILQKAKVRFE